jgi:hypothetical protein
MIKIPPKLIESYKKNSFGIYIGAGMSRASGLPDWETFINDLIDFAKANNCINDGKRDELKSLNKNPANYLLLAEELKDILASDLPKYIKQKFDDKSLKPTETLCKIVKLKYKFIITTNYDTLIEKAYAKVFADIPNPLSYKNASAINYNILTNEPFILKAHGDAKSAANEVILTEKDYRNIIFKEKGYQSVLHVLFSTCNVLFFGASLKDPELKLMLSYIHNIFHGGSPDHFALVNQTDITGTEIDRWRKDFNINIITYDPANNHKQVEDFVDEMMKL